MKRIFVVFMVLAPFVLSSQIPADALRYSQTYPSGSARFVGMGGAFGALGGDFGALSYNPAGLGVFRTSELSFTPVFFNRSDESKIQSVATSNSRTRFGFDNIGLVTTFRNYKGDEKGFVSINLGFGYNKLADFYMESIANTANTSNSIMDFFAIRARGNTWQSMTAGTDYNPYLNGNAPWEAILAWNSFVIDTLGGVYVPLLNEGDGVNQENTILTNGSMGEYVISFAANYSNTLYFGATLGVQNIFYKQSVNLAERAFASNPPMSNGDLFRSLNYLQTYEVDGTGYNFKVGAIYRPIPSLRIGFAAHTPTYINLNEVYTASIRSTFNWGNKDVSTPINRFDYAIDSPFKLLGSLAYTFTNKGLVSFDVERVDYSLMKFSADDVGLFSQQNQSIKDEFRAVQNFRVGGEYWLGNIALRGGYGFYGSPYNSNQLNANSSISIVSGGVGYRNSDLFIDFGYQYLAFNDNYHFYNLVNQQGNNLSPKVERSISQSKFFMTLGFKF